MSEFGQTSSPETFETPYGRPLDDPRINHEPFGNVDPSTYPPKQEDDFMLDEGDKDYADLPDYGASDPIDEGDASYEGLSDYGVSDGANTAYDNSHESSNRVFDPDLVVQYYAAGASKEYFRDAGIDPDEVTKYIKSLPEDERQFLVGKRKEASIDRDVIAKLKSAEPELFEGRVRPDLEAAMREAGYDKYAVGFVQHDGISDLETAVDYLSDQGGVEMVGYGPNQRFLLHDSEHPMENYPLGYYTPKLGRFVYAFPVEATSKQAPRNAVTLESDIPADTFVDNSAGERVANLKYCAGFIDNDQVFYANPRFMQERADSNDDFEGGVQAQVRQLHERAETEGRALNDEEITAIKGLVKMVQQRRAGEKPLDEVTAYLQENAVDTEAVGSRYEAQVQQFVRSLREGAAQEGRDLNPQEIKQIKQAAQTVQDFRRAAVKAA